MKFCRETKKSKNLIAKYSRNSSLKLIIGLEIRALLVWLIKLARIQTMFYSENHLLIMWIIAKLFRLIFRRSHLARLLQIQLMSLANLIF